MHADARGEHGHRMHARPGARSGAKLDGCALVLCAPTPRTARLRHCPSSCHSSPRRSSAERTQTAPTDRGLGLHGVDETDMTPGAACVHRPRPGEGGHRRRTAHGAAASDTRPHEPPPSHIGHAVSVPSAAHLRRSRCATSSTAHSTVTRRCTLRLRTSHTAHRKPYSHSLSTDGVPLSCPHTLPLRHPRIYTPPPSPLRSSLSGHRLAMVRDQPNKPPTEISYPPYSPSPSELEAHHGKAARIEAWTKALPDPHPGTGRSVGAHSAQWSDRTPPSTLRGDLPSLPDRGRGVRRRPTLRVPVAPVLARSPFERDVAAELELPRADHLVHPQHVLPKTAGPGTLRSLREAYFTAALDLPLDMLTEWEDAPPLPPLPAVPPDRDRERRGNLRSLLGRSKSHASLKAAQGPPLQSRPTDARASKGVSLDPAAAAGAAGTLSKMRSMDAILQRASMSGAFQAANGAGVGMQRSSSSPVHHVAHAQLPSHPAVDSSKEGSLDRKSSSRTDTDLQAHPASRKSSTSNAAAAPADLGPPEPVKLARRTSSRGALAHSANSATGVRPLSRTPSPRDPDGSAAKTAVAAGAVSGVLNVLTSDNASRANGSEAANASTSAPPQQQQRFGVTDSTHGAARAPAKVPTAAAPSIKPSDTSRTGARPKAPPLPTVVVTTPPDEGSRRVEASVTTHSNKTNIPGQPLPKRTSSISRNASQTKPSHHTSAPGPSSSTAAAQQPSAPKPASTKEKKRASALVGGVPPSTSKPHMRRRVFSWLGPRKKTILQEDKENQRGPGSALRATVKAAPPPSNPASQRRDELGRAEPQAHPQPVQPPLQTSQRGPPLQPPTVLHGQSQQPSSQSHHQPAPLAHGVANNGMHYGAETHNPQVETYNPAIEIPLHRTAVAPAHEQHYYTPPLSPPIPQGIQLPNHEQQQQHPGPSSVPYSLWPQPPPQTPMATGLVQPRGGMGASAIGMDTGPIRGLQNPAAMAAQHTSQPHHEYHGGYQSGPYTHPGHPLPNVTMQPPMAYAEPPVPTQFTAGRLPPPSAEAILPKRQWFNHVPLFGQSNDAPAVRRTEDAEESQKRMSTSTDSTNLKTQVSSPSTRSEDSAEHTTITLGLGTGQSAASMCSARGSTSHSAASDVRQSTRSLDASRLQDRSHQAQEDRIPSRSTTASPARPNIPLTPLSPTSPCSPSEQGRITAARNTQAKDTSQTISKTVGPVTPPRTPDAGLTLGSGFTPLSMGWDGSSSCDDGTRPTRGSDGARSAGSSDCCETSEGWRSGGGRSSGAPSGEKNASGAAQSCARSTSSSSSGFGVSGTSWSESAARANVSANATHASVPSVSEPMSGLQLGGLLGASAAEAAGVLEWTPAPAAAVCLAHCGMLSVLAPVAEVAEERPLSAPCPGAGGGASACARRSNGASTQGTSGVCRSEDEAEVKAVRLDAGADHGRGEGEEEDDGARQALRGGSFSDRTTTGAGHSVPCPRPLRVVVIGAEHAAAGPSSAPAASTRRSSSCRAPAGGAAAR